MDSAGFWTEVSFKSPFVHLITSQKITSSKFAMMHNFKYISKCFRSLEINRNVKN